MRLGEARAKAKEIYGESGYAVLRGANKKLHVIGFVDKTGSKLGVNVDVASAASFEEAFSVADTSRAAYYLKKSAALQYEFWCAASALEAAIGFNIDRHQDLSQLTVENLRNRTNSAVHPE
jgi:hypothetical protein